jgi:hypothetical protein
MSGTDPLQALRYALDKYPQRMEAVPLEQVVAETARANDHRPAWAKVVLPDEIVKGLRGKAPGRDLVLLVRIPREVLERSESKIILPGEVP